MNVTRRGRSGPPRPRMSSGTASESGGREGLEIDRSTRDRIRTCDLRFRKPTLYPTELRGRDGHILAPGGADFLCRSGRSRTESIGMNGLRLRQDPGGGTRTRTSLTGQRIFLPLRLSPPSRPTGRIRPSVARLWSGLCLHPRGVRPVESLHLLPPLAGAELGSVLPRPNCLWAGGSPNLRRSTSRVAAGALNSCVKSVASADSATPGRRDFSSRAVRRQSGIFARVRGASPMKG